MKKINICIIFLFLSSTQLMSQETLFSVNSFQKASLKSISLSKDVNLIQFHNGQTEIQNIYDVNQARQFKSVDLDSPVVNTSDYGGIFSTGCSIGGGGLVGIPLRFYLTQKFAIEITAGVRPILSLSNSTINLESISFFYTGGLDLYFTKKYNIHKEKV